MYTAAIVATRGIVIIFIIGTRCQGWIIGGQREKRPRAPNLKGTQSKKYTPNENIIKQVFGIL